ncbi:potassium channel family protein [Actinospica robiniae]|uniref:potassium channel family protein n=1 Tax=Actinospica robiniae TaxID=304901 RepID=UPI00040BF44C|nr:potassium channel family protein [Actinospica robiniae]
MTEGADGDGGGGLSDDRRRALRRAAVRAGFRSVLTVTVLGVAYFVLPLEGLRTVGDIGLLIASLIVIMVLIAVEARAIQSADYPGLRAVQALAFTAAFLLFVFSVTYDIMASQTAGAFNAPLTRLDSLYFTVTVFGTVGFGDITAVSQTARAIVTVQMLFDFLFLGVAVRVIAGAVQIGRRRVAGK